MPQEQFAFDFAEPSRTATPVVAPEPVRSLATRLQHLARLNIFVGTSSWKYEGWLGQIYSPAHYQTRGKFSRKKFQDECLGEYARYFPTVCGDFAFYQFPTLAMWRHLFSQVPAGFRFSLKIPEDVTVEKWPDLPRYGKRAGQMNPHFLDPALLENQLLQPLEHFFSKLGVLILEFGTIRTGPLAEPRQFVKRLDQFLSHVPTDRFNISVEVRNPDFLHPGYFDCLRRYNVAHCFNSWTRMPSMLEQIRMAGAFTAPHLAARLLLPPGRTYEKAVAELAPYQRVQQPYPEGREALGELIRQAMGTERTLYAFVNNRLEGNAIQTIDESTIPLE